MAGFMGLRATHALCDATSAVTVGTLGMSSMRFELVALIVVALMLFGARHGRSNTLFLSCERRLHSAFAPFAVGALSFGAVWWVWGSLTPPPLVSDEVSYLLQAKLFVSGRWSAPAPPLPEFFEQEHVLLLPRWASKYPPGHAIMVAPGVLLGMPALVPLLLTAITGELIFLLARRISNGWVAILTWLLWLSTSGNLIYRASYFSEVTTGALWVGGWWATLQWFRTPRLRWLVILAAFVGWGAITRPLTMLAFAFPVGSVVLWRLWRSRRLLDVLAPLATVMTILAIIPLWSSRITGDWRQTPLGIYTRSYMPWDVPGFGVNEVPGTRAAPPDARQKWDGFMARHRDHQLANLPKIATERLAGLVDELFGGWRRWLLPAALAGIFALNAAGWVGVACGLTLFLAYLAYAHPPGWVVYYMELFPIPAFLVALGLWKIAAFMAERVRPDPQAVTMPSARAHVALLFLLPLFASFTLIDTVVAHDWWERRAAHRRHFDRRIASITASRAVVFVRHDPSHSFFTGHVENHADLDGARVWLAHDRGAENRALHQVDPERVAYLYIESDQSLERMAW